MKGIPQGRYTKEFREEAVKMVTEGNISLPEAAHSLSLPPSTLRYWVKVHRGGKLGDIGKTRRPLTEIEMELARVKRELVETPMESFWGTLKQELVHHRRYRTRQEAIQETTEYIEIFYNRQRRQARLGYLSPVAYEQKFYAGQLAA